MFNLNLERFQFLLLKNHIPHIINTLDFEYHDEEVILKFDNQQKRHVFIEKLQEVLDKNNCHIDYTPNSYYVIVKQIIEQSSK